MQLLLNSASLTAIQALLYSIRKKKKFKYGSSDNQTTLKKTSFKTGLETLTKKERRIRKKKKKGRKEELFLFTHSADVYSCLLLSHQCIMSLDAYHNSPLGK